ncbi:MAG TPA: class I SAM-dependent methyltransferase [Candidatus Nitrosotalea sp.]|nr:class I SAM-dependent methyltransferase [Candidatus Nitrosotalea sp.]
MSIGDAGYQLVRRIESLLQGTIAGRLGTAGYRTIRGCHLAMRRRTLIREFGHSALPLISFDDLVGAEPFTLSHYTFAPWSASPIEHALVQALARRLQPCHFLEIGSLRAELLANLNGLVESSVSLSLSKEDMRQRGYPPVVVDTNLMYEPDVQNLKVLYGDSRNFDFSKLPPPRRNLVFIDGDHAYEAVKHDTRNVVENCAAESAIVWHDYTLADQSTVHWPVFAGILDGLPRSLWARLYQVNHTVCAVLLPESWEVRMHETPFRPEKVYSMTLEIRKPATPSRKQQTVVMSEA